MLIETLTDRPTLLIRKLTLAPGECTPWHTDRCERFTVIVAGEELTVEFASSSDAHVQPVAPGMCGWDQPESRVHRAVNSGTSDYVEVVSFYRENAAIDPQPEHPG